MASPSLPAQFPCWVQAIYSWGGETKRDLGFIEGDLIECLNAGDGMWWTGRLRRDRRMVGLFPSNFVKILDEKFKPASSRPSVVGATKGPQNPSRTDSQSTTNSVPQQMKKSIFRKPFKSYAAAGSPNPEAAARDVRQKQSRTSESPSGSLSSRYKPKPYSSMRNVQYSSASKSINSRPPSPTIPAPVPRASSPLPPTASSKNPSRAPSASNYNPISRHSIHMSSSSPHEFHSRQSSRVGSPVQMGGRSRRASPVPPEEFDKSDSPPPPPPPAHRVAYNPFQGSDTEGPDSTQDSIRDARKYSTPRTQSPTPSDQQAGFTPSPLRDAMNDVMSSLEDMSIPQQENECQERQSPDIWSPEAFGEMYEQNRTIPRAHTSLGLEGGFNEVADADASEQYGESYGHYGQNGEAQMDSYVQRMHSRLERIQMEDSPESYSMQRRTSDIPPAPPPKGRTVELEDSNYHPISYSAEVKDEAGYPSLHSVNPPVPMHGNVQKSLKSRKSAYELGRQKLNRTFTIKSNTTTASSTAQSSSTNNSNSTQITGQSIMSGHSAGGFSATSAGSFARRKFGSTDDMSARPVSALGIQGFGSGASGPSYHSSHSSNQVQNEHGSTQGCIPLEGPSNFGGLGAPMAKKKGFLGKMLDSVKTGAASARSNIAASSSSRPSSRGNSNMPPGISSDGMDERSAARDMGLSGNNGDWVQMRRDVNRSNSLSKNERNERAERCEMADIPILTPVDTMQECVEGDEGFDGRCVENATDFSVCNLSLVDKSARFVNNLPALINSASLARGYLCRPYRSDVQRLRAIFTWVSERVSWEEDFEGEVDTRRVIQMKRGCSEEIAVLVAEMCTAIGLQAEVVRGHLKSPNDFVITTDLDETAAHPNHWWNTVVADGQWRILDCSLANPTNPRRNFYSSAGGQVAESWWFLARPTQICYTHVPLLPEQQHIVPSLPHNVLMALPVASPPFFKNKIQMWDFDTSLLSLDGLEMAHIQLSMPDDVECTAEIETRAFATDQDGDFFESGDVVKKRALAQGDFVSCNEVVGENSSFKRYTVKAVLPSSSNSSSSGTLKIYAGKRGLMHSVNNNPHSLALSLPLSHQGPNPDYEFFIRHPTPHALRHELYVTGPLCRRLVHNSTFVFGVRQHPASTNPTSDKPRPSSPNHLGRPTSSMSRPGSAMSMASISVTGSAYSNSSSNASSGNSGPDLQQQKPAKLAIQSPSGKIMRMNRKAEHQGRSGSPSKRNQGMDSSEEGVVKMGSNWETIIKIGERGTWRGLVLADRSARWCVFGEWECI